MVLTALKEDGRMDLPMLLRAFWEDKRTCALERWRVRLFFFDLLVDFPDALSYDFRFG